MKLPTSGGRRAVTYRRRLLMTFAAVAGVHVVGIGLLLVGMSSVAGSVLLTAALFACTRGLIHAADFDHMSVIDNSLRKFIADGRRATSVGLAFSAGHATVVLSMGILVASGSGIAVTLLDESSGAGIALGIIGLAVSGVFLLLLGLNNCAVFSPVRRARFLRRGDRPWRSDGRSCSPGERLGTSLPCRCAGSVVPSALIAIFTGIACVALLARRATRRRVVPTQM